MIFSYLAVFAPLFILLVFPPYLSPCRRPMWDEHGDWLETEPESAKALHRLLCRPVRHLWMESPEARTRHGKVSER